MGGNRSVFSFKQFSLAHGNPGLKISTEACILGAWARPFAKGKILDIGTGCGLLACMLAQSNPNSVIDAIEIHPEVAILASKNIQNSPFKNQIQIILGDIKLACAQANYDFIISNPPFFANHLASSSKDKQMAIHDDALSPMDLALAIKNHLAQNGQFAVIYPKDVMHKFELELNKNELFIQKLAFVYPKHQSEILRVLCLGGFVKQEKISENIYIKDQNNEYTDLFKFLLKPYYLIFE